MSKLLAPFGWVEKLGETTVRNDDLRHCEVQAWTEHPSAIPPSRKLRVAEKEVPIVHSDPDTKCIFGNLQPNLRKKRLSFITSISIYDGQPISDPVRRRRPAAPCRMTVTAGLMATPTVTTTSGKVTLARACPASRGGTPTRRRPLAPLRQRVSVRAPMTWGDHHDGPALTRLLSSWERALQ